MKDEELMMLVVSVAVVDVVEELSELVDVMTLAEEDGLSGALLHPSML